MQELIHIKVENDKQLVSARDLYKGLKIKTRFSLWVNQNFKSFEEKQDFMSVVTTTDMPNGGTKQIQDYVLTIDMAKELCMMSKTSKGSEVRKYFIQVEKNWNNPDMIVQRALAIQNSKVQLLEHKNKLLEDKNAKQAEKIAKDADDVVFAKAIRYSHHAISISELAEILTQNGFVIGRNQLFQLLRNVKYLSHQRNTWNLPMTDKVKRGYFRITHGITRDERPYSQVWVTPKGQKHIINKALRGQFDDAYQEVMVTTFNV